MAERVIADERELRRGSGLAATFTLFTLLLAIAAIVVAWIAIARADNAIHQANAAIAKTDNLSTKLSQALNTFHGASTGGGAGPNSSQPVIPSTNTTPNGNGQ